jgi:hypothetical protein
MAPNSQQIFLKIWKFVCATWFSPSWIIEQQIFLQIWKFVCRWKGNSFFILKKTHTLMCIYVGHSKEIQHYMWHCVQGLGSLLHGIHLTDRYIRLQKPNITCGTAFRTIDPLQELRLRTFISFW